MVDSVVQREGYEEQQREHGEDGRRLDDHRGYAGVVVSLAGVHQALDSVSVDEQSDDDRRGQDDVQREGEREEGDRPVDGVGRPWGGR